MTVENLGVVHDKHSRTSMFIFNKLALVTGDILPEQKTKIDKMREDLMSARGQGFSSRS